MTVKRIVVHIGLEKTGTTSVQRFLARNRHVLQSQGYWVPSSLGEENHVVLCLMAQRRDPPFRTVWNLLGIRDVVERDNYVSKSKAALFAEISGLKPHIHTVLLSNEHLHSNLISSEELCNLRDVLSLICDEVKILVYVRRQDLLAVSLFSTRIKGGGDWEIEGLFPLRDGSVPFYFRFSEILEGYADVFGASNLMGRVYEKGKLISGDIIEDYCATVGISLRDNFVIPARMNESVGMAALYTLSLLNRSVPCFIDEKWNRNRDGLVEYLERNFPGKSFLASRSDARRFYAFFRSSNEEMRRRFLPQFGAPLFSEDFDSYPEVAASLPSSREISEVFASLWNEQASVRRELTQRLQGVGGVIERAGN